MSDLHSSVKGIISTFNFPRFFVILFWLFGLSLGCQIAHKLSQESLRMIYNITNADFSVMGLLISVFIPFVITLFIMRTGKIYFLFVLSFANALLFGFCLTALKCCFLDAGWLLSRLFLFSQSLCTCLLLWVWLRFTGDRCRAYYKLTCICLLLLIFIVLFDSLLVVPFIGTLFNH